MCACHSRCTSLMLSESARYGPTPATWPRLRTPHTTPRLPVPPPSATQSVTEHCNVGGQKVFASTTSRPGRQSAPAAGRRDGCCRPTGASPSRGRPEQRMHGCCLSCIRTAGSSRSQTWRQTCASQASSPHAHVRTEALHKRQNIPCRRRIHARWRVFRKALHKQMSCSRNAAAVHHDVSMTACTMCLLTESRDRFGPLRSVPQLFTACRPRPCRI